MRRFHDYLLRGNKLDKLLHKLVGYVERETGKPLNLGELDLNELRQKIKEAAFWYEIGQDEARSASRTLHTIGPALSRIIEVLAHPYASELYRTFYYQRPRDENNVIEVGSRLEAFIADLKNLAAAVQLPKTKGVSGRPPLDNNLHKLVGRLSHIWEIATGRVFTVRRGARFVEAAVAYIDPASAGLPAVKTAMRRIAERRRSIKRQPKTSAGPPKKLAESG